MNEAGEASASPVAAVPLLVYEDDARLAHVLTRAIGVVAVCLGALHLILFPARWWKAYQVWGRGVFGGSTTLQAVRYSSVLVLICLYVWTITSGVQCLRLSPRARRSTLWCAWATIAFSLLSWIVNLGYYLVNGSFAKAGGGYLMLYLVSEFDTSIGFATFPILVVVLFRRPASS